MLPAAYRLRRPDEVRRVRRVGKAFRHPLLILLQAPTGEGGKGSALPSRFAFVASRRVGNAVTRNRCKRHLREAVRRQIASIEPGWDCICIARPALVGAAFVDVQRAVQQQLRRACLLQAPDDE